MYKGKRRGGFPFSREKDFVRKNHGIKAVTVRVIDEKGGQLGVFQTRDAVKLAEERGLDLVEMAANAKPPVCKIISYGKYKYQQKKKQHQAKLKQTVILVKEVKMRPNIDKHDYEFKLKHVERFLNDGNKAKITINFRGRELAHQDLGRNLLDRVWSALKDHAVLELPAKREGRDLIMVVAPGKVSKPKSTPKGEPKSEVKPEAKKVSVETVVETNDTGEM